MEADRLAQTRRGQLSKKNNSRSGQTLGPDSAAPAPLGSAARA
ncbi:MAG: hypothetical protein ABSG18_22700 [Steroidobacteraceae bacterium]